MRGSMSASGVGKPSPVSSYSTHTRLGDELLYTHKTRRRAGCARSVVNRAELPAETAWSDRDKRTARTSRPMFAFARILRDGQRRSARDVHRRSAPVQRAPPLCLRRELDRVLVGEGLSRGGEGGKHGGGVVADVEVLGGGAPASALQRRGGAGGGIFDKLQLLQRLGEEGERDMLGRRRRLHRLLF